MHTAFFRFFALAFAAVQLTGTLAILPRASSSSQRSGCTEPSTRVEWNTLTQEEKDAYFAAELCLLAAPAQTNIPDVVSRYDDLVGVHSEQSDLLGGNDRWHDFVVSFVDSYMFIATSSMLTKTLLRSECGYIGPNEVVDAGSFTTSPVVVDFGGEGTEANDWVVVDGPFANLTRYLGPGSTNTNHMITRQENVTWSLQAGQIFVENLLELDTFATFKDTMFAGLHAAGHIGIGGEVFDVQTSPNDPIFWMHHGYVDYMWWRWQGDNETRINDLEGIGYETQKEPDTGYVETNKDTVLYLFDILPNAMVGDVLDTQKGLLCYTYA
ncbi:uncharacterized protein EV420DRAFT_1670085 [Desarmillaria tabescens]|uniref:Tyrosinase copper-binding domain-containing protein n=1 Tax=Armillaria tabescens TaxID=1929756 RepID=A0AA39J8P7_ARMTA|nr:uncharacterized protein EV420DRAFT_1670085 [Desarmillaria tabescens]KAK0437261.1 hypothetical protein EV420DRAFT_1670085 [Desarmillaria tabescens]